MQRGEGGGTVGGVVAAPEPASPRAHVPVGQIINERLERTAGVGGVVARQAVGDRVDGGIEARERPAVHLAALGHGRRRVAGREAVGQRCVGGEERVGVPQGEQEATAGLVNHVEAEAERIPRALRGEQIPAEGVGAGVVEHRPGLHHVALALAHLLALAIEDEPQAHHVAVGRLVEQQRALGQQRVEPAAGLVERLAHEVGGEPAGQPVLALEGVVVLRERHGARVEPHVGHLGHAVRGAAALAADGHLVHERPVRVELLAHLHHGVVAQRLERPDGRDLLAVVAAPERQRRAPVALAADGPVDVALEPAAEAAVLDVLGVPAHLLVERQHAVAHIGGADVPRRLGVIEQRRGAAPAVRVRVLVGLLAEHPAAALEVGDQLPVGVLHEHAHGLGHLVGEQALAVNRVGGIQPVLARGAHVVLAECRRQVHDSRAVLGGDEVAHHHDVPARDVPEWRLVRSTSQVGRRHGALHHGVVADHLGHKRLGHHQSLAIHVHHRVGGVGIDRCRLIGGKRPRRGGPHQERRAGLVHQGEPHVDGRVGHVLVALGHLVAAQCGAASGAVRHDLVAFVHQALVEHGGQAPPHALDVVGVHGAVRLRGVHPEPDAIGQALPLVEVLAHRGPAARVELGDAVRLDLGLARDAQLLLHLELHGQAVAVPAGRALHVAAAHGVEPREDVLEHARQHVVRPRTAVCRGRTLVEHVRVGALAVVHAALEHIVVAPEREHALLHGRPLGGRPHGAPLAHAASATSGSFFNQRSTSWKSP